MSCNMPKIRRQNNDDQTESWRISQLVSRLLMFYMASQRLSRLHMFMIPRVIILARRVLCNVNDFSMKLTRLVLLLIKVIVSQFFPRAFLCLKRN